MRRRAEPIEQNLERTKTLAKSAWEKGDALAAAGDFTGAIAWLGRAHRIAISDQNILFALACAHLRGGDAGGAAPLFATLADRHGTRECLSGLIAASLAMGRIDAASEAAQRALSTCATDPALAALAGKLAEAGGPELWCGVDEAGALLTNAPGRTLSVLLDGAACPVRPVGPGKFRLGRKLAGVRRLEVRAGDRVPLGSPLLVSRMFRIEGFAERSAQGVSGWAWHPGAPSLDPRLAIIEGTGGESGGSGGGKVLARFTASTLLDTIEGSVPLARPRGFARRIARGGAVRVVGEDGGELFGSPVAPEDAPLPGPHPAARKRLRPISPGEPDVVIPVYRGIASTLACIESVRQTVPPSTRIWVVNDASPEPELVASLQRLAKARAIRLIQSDPGGRNRGFPAAANAGMRAAGSRHVVLLNSDTLVAPGWLETLRDAALSAPDIGTATPISNDASILSYPDEAGKNPVPDLAGTWALAALAARANRGRLVEIPTAHGFCMFIRRDCLDATGYFEEQLFAQGYGEENDFTERARALGWRHVAVPEVYVAHLGGASFGAARMPLLRRNLGLLERRHPGYHARVAAWIAADPLEPSRRRLDMARFAKASKAAPPALLLVTHGSGGGTAKMVRERAAAARAGGYRPIVLRAVDGFCEIGEGVCEEAREEGGNTPNLRFSLPAEFPALLKLLAGARPAAAELHHLLGHDHSVVRLFAALAIPYDVWVHDYAWFCARLSFTTGESRFCGEAESAVCETCIARWGREIEEDIAPAALRARSADDLRGARAVIVPSEDVGKRIARHVPGLCPVIRPWEPEPPPAPPRPRMHRSTRRVAVVGAIGMEKGFDVLLACARDAAARRLRLEFVVVGYTVNDEDLLATEKVFVTGQFAAGEAASLIRAQAADLAFLPSIWPETWCYALTDAWAGGLPAAVFDIGTPPARVRAAGRGWVLPLGLPAPRVNDVLLSLAMLNTNTPSFRAM